MPTRLAKLTRPRLHQVVPRERLFAWLDAMRARPATWVAAEPGAGKTTLVASWVEARRAPCVWVQVDTTDSDPGTFFHYLREAVAAACTPKRPRLPTYAPEFAAGLEAFGRRFFRSLFAALPVGTVIVLDNFQDASGEAFEAVVRAALEEVAEHVHVVIVSRELPGTAFARFVANERFATLGAADLRLAEGESRALAASRGVLSEAAFARLHRLAGGWAAGMTLMIEGLKRGGTAEAAPDEDVRAVAFEYFAGELFQALPARDQHTLLAASFLPTMTASAVARVSGSPDAGRLLEALYRRRMFTDRRSGAQPMYQFHALFRAFLRARAAAQYGPERASELAAEAGRTLRESGDVESALDLFAEAHEWEAFAGVLESVAEQWLDQGRRLAWLERADTLPAQVRAARPWSQFWEGMARIAFDVEASVLALEAAFEAFRSLDDRHGMRLSCCGLVDARHVGYIGIPSLDRWVEVLAHLLPLPDENTDPGVEFKLLYALLTAGCFFRHRDPRLPDYAARILDLMRLPVGATTRLRAGHVLMRYGAYGTHRDVALEALALTEPLLAESAVSDADRLIWYCRAIMVHLFCCRFDEAARFIEPATAIARIAPKHPAVMSLVALRTTIAATRGQSRAIEAALGEVPAEGGGADPFSRGALAVARMLASMYRGEHAIALVHARTATEGLRASGMVHSDCEFTLCEIHLLRVLGRHGEADAAAERLRSTVADSFLDHLACDLDLVEAYAALHTGDLQACDEYLAQALSDAKRSFFWVPRMLPGVLPDVFARALDAGIEPEAVRARIRAMQVSPPSPAAAGWPWPVKIRVLGAFEVERRGDNPTARRKPAHRLLDLLALLAASPQSGVSATRLADALWPDSEGDAGVKLLEVSLHRLRKLLGDDAAVHIRDGRVRLDSQVCGVDVWAFEHRCDAMAGRTAGDGFDREATSALALYRGHLLEAEPDHPWILSSRERLRSRWLGVVHALGAWYEQRQRWADAAETYDRATALDPANELLYRRRIAVLQQQGNRSEALRAFEVCKRMLSAHLGTRPSDETRRLAEEGAGVSGQSFKGMT